MAPNGGLEGSPPVPGVLVTEYAKVREVYVKVFFVSRESSVKRRERRFQNYVISKLTQNHLFFTSFTSNYSFFTLLTLPLWLSTPPYPHLPLFYPPSRLDGCLDGYSTGTRRVDGSHSRPTLPVVGYYRSLGTSHVPF